MADLLASGAAWLADRLAASASTPVRYQRGASYGQVNATVGSSSFQSANENGIIETWQSRDFIIRVGALPFGEPKRADLIVETINGIDTTYEVTAPPNAPLFQYGDAFRQTVRVHTIAKSESAGVPAVLRRRFWGAFSGDSITGAQIAAALSSDLGGSRGQVRTINCDTSYLYVVIPTAFGTPTFSVSGLQTSAFEASQRTMTFAGQSALSYGIYRSTYPITGTVILTVT